MKRRRGKCLDCSLTQPKLHSASTSLLNMARKLVGSILGSGLGRAQQLAAYSKPPFTSGLPSIQLTLPRALTNKYSPAKLRVYARPDDSDIYLPSLLSTATQMSADDSFEPTLIVLGTRLGINGITPAYHTALKHALELPQSVGIAGGRPSASHYFIGHQNDQFFYLDPHSTRPMLSASPTAEEVDAVHTRRVRRLGISEMDPSMLIGFLIHTKQELEEWRKAVEGAEGKSFIHFHDQEPSYSTGASGGGGVGHERPEAVDEVETWDETGDEDK